MEVTKALATKCSLALRMVNHMPICNTMKDAMPSLAGAQIHCSTEDASLAGDQIHRSTEDASLAGAQIHRSTEDVLNRCCA